MESLSSLYYSLTFEENEPPQQWEISFSGFIRRTQLKMVSLAWVCLAMGLFTLSLENIAIAIGQGERGADVTTLQEKLKDEGYFTGPVTGYYGSITANAVRRFQQANQLGVDGIAGDKTQGKLYDRASTVSSTDSRPREAATTTPSPQRAAATTTPKLPKRDVSLRDGPVLQRGQNSETVRKLQLRLKQLGYFHGPTTGYYGTLTEMAVKHFQGAQQLAPDGVVGPKTQAMIAGKNTTTPLRDRAVTAPKLELDRDRQPVELPALPAQPETERENTPFQMDGFTMGDEAAGQSVFSDWDSVTENAPRIDWEQSFEEDGYVDWNSTVEHDDEADDGTFRQQGESFTDAAERLTETSETGTLEFEPPALDTPEPDFDMSDRDVAPLAPTPTDRQRAEFESAFPDAMESFTDPSEPFRNPWADADSDGVEPTEPSLASQASPQTPFSQETNAFTDVADRFLAELKPEPVFSEPGTAFTDTVDRLLDDRLLEDQTELWIEDGDRTQEQTQALAAPEPLRPPLSLSEYSATFAEAARAVTGQMALKTTIYGNIAPKSIVHSGKGLFFAQNMMYTHSVTVYDRNYQLVKTISDAIELQEYGYPQYAGMYRGAPVEATFSHDGQYAWISNYQMYGSGFDRPGTDKCSPAQETDPSFLYRVNTDNFEIDRVVKVGSVPKQVAATADNRYVLVTNWCTDDLSVVDVERNREVRRIKLGRYPRGVVIDEAAQNAYVAVMGSHRIAKVNLIDFQVNWLGNVGRSPRHLNIDPQGRYLYTSLNGEGRVGKIDLRTGRTVAKVVTGNAPRGMTLSQDGQHLYVVNYESDTMTKVRTDDMRVLHTVAVNDKPIGVTYDAETSEVWVSCYSGSIMVFEG